MTTARYWHKIDKDKAACDLCPHHCRLTEGKSGLCKVRSLRDGVMKADGYGLISSAGIDPIEKKPLYHFFPGTKIFSIGGWGCNLACKFCQNWTISQNYEASASHYTAEQVVEKASDSGSIGVAYTYNEPIIGIEFVEDCAKLARSRGLRNVLVTNGFIAKEPAAELLPVIDALNIDIKSIDGDFYKKQCRGMLAPVLAFAEQAVKAGRHVEITNLIIPTLNDSDRWIEDLAQWVKDHLGVKTPLHLSAYHPQYKMNIQATSRELLERAYDISASKLKYVYLGNVSTEVGRDTLCQQCGNVLVSRRGYNAISTGIAGCKCRICSCATDVIC